MTTHPVEHIPDDRPPRVTLLPLVSGGLAIALVVAVSVGHWQRADRDHATLAGDGPVAAVTAAESAAVTPIRGAVPAARAATTPTIYLVASQAQADAVQQELTEAYILGAALGTAPPTASVVWFPSVEAEVYFWSVIGEQERAGTSMDPVTVVDRRHAAAAPPIETVFLVSTPEQAAALQTRIAATADHQGAPPPNARVVVVGTDEAAIALHVINEIVPTGRSRLIDRRLP